MMEKTFITVSHKLGGAPIKTTVTRENEGVSIKLQMSMEDFVKSLKQEVGSVRWTFRKATFEKQLDEAIFAVIKAIKQESKKVM